MKKLFIFLFMAAITMPWTSAQTTNQKRKAFEQAYARNMEPTGTVFIQPQTVDLKYLSTNRESYGPYTFKISNIKDLTVIELENFKNRALYQAQTMEGEDVDIFVGAIFDSYTLDGDPTTLYVEFSGYPAKFVNFRALPVTPENMNMLSTIGRYLFVPETQLSPTEKSK